MTADVELLPLPEFPVAVERFILSSLGPVKREGAVTALRTMLREYARANMAPLQAEIEALRMDLADYMRIANTEATRAERLAEALEDIRSRSSIDLAMRSDQFELTARLGDIYQIAAAALAQEADQ